MKLLQENYSRRSTRGLMASIRMPVVMSTKEHLGSHDIEVRLTSDCTRPIGARQTAVNEVMSHNELWGIYRKVR